MRPSSRWPRASTNWKRRCASAAPFAPKRYSQRQSFPWLSWFVWKLFLQTPTPSQKIFNALVARRQHLFPCWPTTGAGAHEGHPRGAPDTQQESGGGSACHCRQHCLLHPQVRLQRAAMDGMRDSMGPRFCWNEVSTCWTFNIYPPRTSNSCLRYFCWQAALICHHLPCIFRDRTLHWLVWIDKELDHVKPNVLVEIECACMTGLIWVNSVFERPPPFLLPLFQVPGTAGTGCQPSERVQTVYQMSHGQDFVTQNVGLRRQAMSFEYLESKTFPLCGPGKLRSWPCLRSINVQGLQSNHW